MNEVRRRTPEQRAERTAVSALWKLAKRAPSRHLLRDPDSGHFLGVDCHLSFLEVVVSDVDFTDERSDEIPDAVVTKYGIGGVWRPMSPPILRMQDPINDDGAPRRTWRESGDALRFNDRTGAMNASLDELTDLHAQLERALRAQ